MHLLSAERTASMLYQQAQLRLLQDKTEDILAYITTVTQQLQQLWQKHQSFVLFDLYYKLHIRQLELVEDYPQLLVLTVLADEFVKDLKINIKRFDYTHNYALRVYASLRAGDLVNGLQLAQEGIHSFDPASEKWLSYYESYWLLAMHSGEYMLASDIYKQVEQSKVYLKATTFTKEKWYLFKAFLYLMHPDQQNNFFLDQHLMKQRLPNSRKDKQGYNITILIAEFCFLLFTNQKDILAKKAETYKKYVERHFGNLKLVRERIFFLLMLLVVRHNFHYEQVVNKSTKLVRQLNQSLLPKGAHSSRIEIVPYQQLWNKIKDLLLRRE
jgi:hypothetical protein